jgi:hypothetical protein
MSDAIGNLYWRLGLPLYLGFFGVIVSLLSLEQGQAFPQWMVPAYLVLLISVGIKGVQVLAHSISLAKTRLPSLVAALGVVFLGVGIGVTAHVGHPVDIGGKAIADVAYGLKSGDYKLTDSNGTLYYLHRDSFQPSLPDLTDHRYVGRPVWMVVDQGTRQVLKITLEETDYIANEYANPGSVAVKSILLAILLTCAGGLSFAICLTRAVRKAPLLQSQ